MNLLFKSLQKNFSFYEEIKNATTLVGPLEGGDKDLLFSLKTGLIRLNFKRIPPSP